MKAFAEAITIGRLIRPQGRKGELLIEPLSDRPERFYSLRKVFVETAGGGAREFAVTDCWPHKGRFVIKFAGVDSIDAAEKLRGFLLGIAEAELAPLPPGCFYHHQLRGLRAQDGSGRSLGSVRNVLETGGVPVLEIAGDDRRELLLPLAEPFIAAVDLEAGTLTVVVPEAEREAAG